MSLVVTGLTSEKLPLNLFSYETENVVVGNFLTIDGFETHDISKMIIFNVRNIPSASLTNFDCGLFKARNAFEGMCLTIISTAN